MELILLILKIILIAFLIVLGLIVLLVALILFVPIRYEVSGELGDSWELHVKGKLTYLLSILKLIFMYQNGQTDMQIYIFGFQKKKKNEENEDTSEAEDAEIIEDAEITLHEKAEKGLNESSDIQKEEPSVEPKEDLSKLNQKDTKGKEKKKEKSKFDFTFWKTQITDEHNQYVVKKIGSELLYLLKHFKFRRIQTDLVFSTGDPASTGQVLGVLCMIPMLYRYDFKIVPDFEAEDTYLKGTFLVAGKVRLIHLLMTLLRLIFDKEVRLVVKRILALLNE